ncbi:MAG: TatD family hydrolase [Hyphomicrobiales bacterium]|nr:TatD family hydrolase [Hyphomicrobiales bacterium]
MLVDSHCHLDFPDFAEELDQVVARAEAAGVKRMLTICTRVRHFDQVRAIAERFENVFCSVGTHPNNAGEEMDVTSDQLIAHADHPKVVAIGEAGLDYHYGKSKRAQATGLRIHIEASRVSGLPLVIHSRDADEDMIETLKRETGQGAFPAVLHCYSSGRDLAMTGVDIGMYVSFSGILTFKGAGELREIAAEIPLDRLLVETDAPYLAPTPYRGKRNEPSYVVNTARVLAEVKGVSEEEIWSKTTANFFRLFNKIQILDTIL